MIEQVGDISDEMDRPGSRREHAAEPKGRASHVQCEVRNVLIVGDLHDPLEDHDTTICNEEFIRFTELHSSNLFQPEVFYLWRRG